MEITIFFIHSIKLHKWCNSPANMRPKLENRPGKKMIFPPRLKVLP